MINNVSGRGIEKIYKFSFAEVINIQWGRIMTVIFTLKFLLGVKVIHLIDMTGFFKIRTFYGFQLFMKLPFCCLKHLESLRLGHAKRLMR